MTGASRPRAMIRRAAVLSPGGRRLLHYWSLNVMLARAGGWGWIPGFSYDPPEQRRIAEIAAAIPGAAVLAWLTATIAIFIGIAIAATTGFMVPMMALLWPDPSMMSGLSFALLMAMVLLATFGLGMPLAMSLGGAVADRVGGCPRLPEAPGDAALAARIRGQFWRFGAALSIGFIPAVLVFLAWGTDAAWVGTALHGAAVGSALFGLVCNTASRRLRGDVP
jgi:hypothetical protein